MLNNCVALDIHGRCFEKLPENLGFWTQAPKQGTLWRLCFPVQAVMGSDSSGGLVQKCGKMPWYTWYTCKILVLWTTNLWPQMAIGAYHLVFSENRLDLRNPSGLRHDMTAIILTAHAPPHFESAKANDPRDLGSFENPAGRPCKGWFSRRTIPLGWLQPLQGAYRKNLQKGINRLSLGDFLSKATNQGYQWLGWSKLRNLTCTASPGAGTWHEDW